MPDSILKKKSQRITYHFIREGSARDEWWTSYINTLVNPVDLLTKPLAGSTKRIDFVTMRLHHIFGSVDYTMYVEPLKMLIIFSAKFWKSLVIILSGLNFYFCFEFYDRLMKRLPYTSKKQSWKIR